MSKITFTYRLVGDGWARAYVANGTNELYVSASYSTNALRDITDAAISLLIMEMPTTVRITWDVEPGEYRWIFEPEGDDVHLRILWFDDTSSRLPDERGKLLFEADCNILKFAIQVKTALRDLLEEHGMEGYKQIWSNHDFPIGEYERLKVLIREREAAVKSERRR